MPVCGNYLFFELPKKIVLNPKDGEECGAVGGVVKHGGADAGIRVGHSRHSQKILSYFEWFAHRQTGRFSSPRWAAVAWASASRSNGSCT